MRGTERFLLWLQKKEKFPIHKRLDSRGKTSKERKRVEKSSSPSVLRQIILRVYKVHRIVTHKCVGPLRRGVRPERGQR